MDKWTVKTHILLIQWPVSFYFPSVDLVSSLSQASCSHILTITSLISNVIKNPFPDSKGTVCTATLEKKYNPLTT